MKLKNICIIDGSYFLHRCMKQQNLFDLRNSELERTGGIYGFLNIFQKEIRMIGDYFPIVCWDNGQSIRRLTIYDNYKKHLDRMNDPDFKPLHKMSDIELDEDYVYQYKLQRKKLIELLNAFGIPNLQFKHTEGDDLMYWLTQHSEKSIVMSDDRDMLQVLSENCRVKQCMKEVTYTIDSFLEEYELDSVDAFIRRKAFCGDGSDNIPGCCFQVGEKSVSEFFKLYKILKAKNDLNFLKVVDEKGLKEFCKANDIKYKKAYINFDEDQFLKNLELVDLRKVRADEFDDEGIYTAIRNVYKTNNIKRPLELLNRYEIKTVNTNIIFETLIMSRHNIKDN